MHIDLHENCKLFVSNCNEISVFSTDFRKMLKKSNFAKIRPVETGFFHADRQKDGETDGRTDVTKLIEAFHNFVNALTIHV